MIEVHYTASFDRVFKKLPPSLKDNVEDTASKVIDLYLCGKRTAGLGITRLRGPIWEARTDIRIRVVYTLAKNRLTFVLAGSHNDIKNFLKNY